MSISFFMVTTRVTSHIPDKGQVMIRYYDLYSNARRGKINKKVGNIFTGLLSCSLLIPWNSLS
ncbi:MAG: hypothetical protein GQ536_09725 [Candidatus Aminicenantes bacterium]|nr:hypothetical protein [Candidatus Aminicenantes bacterium]